MRRYISAKERRYYTHMLEIILALGGKALPYKWLISGMEAYPAEREKYADMVEKNEYLILSNTELLEMLTEDDFQWIWAIFSAIPEQRSDAEILEYELPSVDNVEIYKKDVAIIQHPLAELEIVAVDSSNAFIVARDEKMAEKFRDLFPKATENY